MRITRLVAGAVTAGLLGVTPIAISAPAHADGQTYTPVITFELIESGLPSEAPFEYGQDFYVSGKITDPTGIEGPSGGQAFLQVSTASNPTWTTVATDVSPSYLFFDGGFKFTENAQFKVVFTGSTALGSWDDSYTAGESLPAAVPVARKLTLKNPRGTFIKGKVAPTYKKKPILIHKKVGKKWKKFRKIKTNKRSAFSITLPAYRKRTYFRISVKGNSQFATASSVGSTIRYRPSTGRLVIQ